jgi:hypothetical protein
MGIADEAALIAHKLRYSGSSKEYYPLAKVGGNGRSKSMCQSIPAHGHAKACGVVAYQANRPPETR